ncbi:MAG: hypothetical protein HY735_00190 [Verrucomicrobia bacterium]|nr:hypothetical protein [Verrucomicrobiota bacterium]
MPLDTLIARWVAILWLICGVSHLLHPATWAKLLLPLRDRDTGGFILAGMSLPVGLIIILGHNIWVWGLPVIVTVAGWMTTLKSVIYLLFPRAHVRVMSSDVRVERGIRIVGAVLMVLGALTAYDSFYRR